MHVLHCVVLECIVELLNYCHIIQYNAMHKFGLLNNYVNSPSCPPLPLDPCTCLPQLSPHPWFPSNVFPACIVPQILDVCLGISIIPREARPKAERSEVTNRVGSGQTTWLASPSKSSREFLYMYIYICLYFKGVRSQARLPGNSSALENC